MEFGRERVSSIIVLNFLTFDQVALIFDQVVRLQFWSHDQTKTQVHNFNIYSYIVESFIRFYPVVVEFGRGVATYKLCWNSSFWTKSFDPSFGRMT